MSAAPETKYTDRDVRENVWLNEQAIEYVRNYEGEFEFLVACKQRLAMDRNLTIGMTRGVLNCMRADPRVPFDMPEPLPVEVAEVIPMFSTEPKKSKKTGRDREYICPLLEAGIFHHHKEQEGWKREGPIMKHCYGLYRINRMTTWIKNARVHDDVLYALGKSPAVIKLHKINHIVTVWRHPEHTYGWDYNQYPYDQHPRSSEFGVHVKLGCKYPSWLNEPILLRQSDVDEYNLRVDLNQIDKDIDAWKSDGKTNPTKLIKCKWCFPDEVK